MGCKPWLASALLLAACTNAPHAQTATGGEVIVDSVLRASCTNPPSAPPSDEANLSVQGESANGSVVALLFTRTGSSVLPTGEDQKIVWRVSGTGPARFHGTGPDDSRLEPLWAEAQGDEWGTGFLFSASGCWTLHVTRDDMTGSLEVLVR